MANKSSEASMRDVAHESGGLMAIEAFEEFVSDASNKQHENLLVRIGIARTAHLASAHRLRGLMAESDEAGLTSADIAAHLGVAADECESWRTVEGQE